ncbi:hypothetical protein FOZ62_026602, partial [Perkinsus olseni]
LAAQGGSLSEVNAEGCVSGRTLSRYLKEQMRIATRFWWSDERAKLGTAIKEFFFCVSHASLWIRREVTPAASARYSLRGCISIVSKFFHAVVSGSKSFPPVGPIGGPRAPLAQANQMTDASLGVVGGIIALAEGAAGSAAGSRQPVVWLQEKVSRELIGQWKGISADAQVPLESRDIVTLELLAVCVAIRLAERRFGQWKNHRVAISVDNQAARRILSKLYSRTPVLARLLRNTTQHLARLVLSDYVVCRVASENNTIADKLSRSDASSISQHWIRETVEKEWMSAAKLSLLGYMIRRRQVTGLLRGAERAGVNVDAEVAALVRDALAEKSRKLHSSHSANLYSAVFRDGIREGESP